MKKSLLNIAVSIAMSGALLSGSVFSSQAYADNADSAGTESTDNKETSLKTYMYPGMSVGAATGTVVAGPVGFLLGGLIGAVVGANQEMTEPGITTEVSPSQDTIADNTDLDDVTPARQSKNSLFAATENELSLTPAIQVAQAGPLHAVVPAGGSINQDDLIDVLTADLSLDVYFRSGSSDIETFYPARLAAIANLLNTVDSLHKDKLELHLDGYTDRRGDKQQNIALANERIEKVRQQLIAAGVAEDRINSQAFGEMKMVSTAGDLEGYTFDRKVVIRFERTAADSISAMKTALSGFDTEETVHSEKDEKTSPVVADNSSRF
jgi:outer membrane protein OmpA-like peptidoglycan-associated protein